jgi:glycosyltransferase involved in cell wall biosynthesis
MQPRSPALRIVHVVDSLEVGGLERVVADLAQTQQAAGDWTSVFSLDKTEGLKAELSKAGIDVVEGHKRPGPDLRSVMSLRRWVRGNRIDVVHAHNFVPNYYAAAALLGLGRPPIQVCTLHDMGTRLAKRKLRLLFKASLARTARVAMVGQQVYDRFVEGGLIEPGRASTVRNGVRVERFTPTPERRERARAALGLSGTDVVLGCVGRLVALKNHCRVIEVMPALLVEHPGLRLVIVGDGPQRSALQEQVERLGLLRHVTLAGQRSDVIDLLPAFDVFALPSQTEGLSIALLEACATRVAVVATRVGGNPEIIDDGQTGMLIPVDDNDALRDAIGHLLRDTNLRDRLGGAARRWVLENASTRSVRDAYDAFYRAELGGA